MPDVDSIAAPVPPVAGGVRSPPSGRTQWFGLRAEIPPWAYRGLFVLSFAALLGLWWLISVRQLVNPIFLPSPARVWATAWELWNDEVLWIDVKVSVTRVTAGFLLSAALALPIGILMGSFKICEGMLQPLTEYVRYIPVPALIPLLMLFFGIGEQAKIMLIFVGVFFQLVLMVADEVRRVPHDLVQVSQTLGAQRGEIIRLVLFRAAMPGIFDALRLCNGWAWTYLVVAELIAANEGMGYRVLKFSRFLQTPKIFVYLILLGFIGLALDFAFRKFNQRVFHWADATRR